jgi:hypothetical protein
MSLCYLKTDIVFVAVLSVITEILHSNMMKLSDVSSTQMIGERLNDVLSLKIVESVPLLCANDVNLFNGNVTTIKRNTEALSVASEETGLQGNAKKTNFLYDHISTQACKTSNVKRAKK